MPIISFVDKIIHWSNIYIETKQYDVFIYHICIQSKRLFRTVVQVIKCVQPRETLRNQTRVILHKPLKMYIKWNMCNFAQTAWNVHKMKHV